MGDNRKFAAKLILMQTDWMGPFKRARSAGSLKQRRLREDKNITINCRDIGGRRVVVVGEGWGGVGPREISLVVDDRQTVVRERY